jgi:nucleolar protein 56
MYKFTNVLGTFMLDDKLNITTKKGPTKDVPEDKLLKVLTLFNDSKYFPDFYKKNVALTKKSLRDSVTQDLFIIQAVANLTELDKMCNILSKRLREWYSWYYPEFSQEVTDNQKYAELVLTAEKKSGMGADVKEIHLNEMFLLAKEITSLFALRKKHELYLEKIMKTYCPNILALAGVTVGAKLIELSRGLKRLALLPASTVQLLGAEKALFRHIKTGSKSPKYGCIFQHPLIQKAKRQDRGKAARQLADKLSLCARLDYFKGEFKGDEYRSKLEEKFL